MYTLDAGKYHICLPIEYLMAWNFRRLAGLTELLKMHKYINNNYNHNDNEIKNVGQNVERLWSKSV